MLDTVLRLWKHDTVEILGLTGTVVSPTWQNKIKENNQIVDGKPVIIRSGSITIEVDGQIVKVDIPDIDSGELYPVKRWECCYCGKDLQPTGEFVEMSRRVTAEVKVCSHHTKYLCYQTKE